MKLKKLQYHFMKHYEDFAVTRLTLKADLYFIHLSSNEMFFLLLSN